MKPNLKFELNVKDIELIEYALRNSPIARTNEAQQVLGKIHNQKNWYRPKENYVGG